MDYDSLARELRDFSCKLGERGNNLLPAARNDFLLCTTFASKGRLNSEESASCPDFLQIT